jgi:2-haloacid dehalogenase/putative hydrolase of the HAD superfamily
MAGRRFDALFVDFYGTVASGDSAAVAAACEVIVRELGLPFTTEEFAITWGRRYFALVDDSNGERFRTLHECEMASLQETVRPHVGEIDAAPLVAGLEAYWRNPGIHADAREMLAAVDLPTCCVSNADTTPLDIALRRHGVRFDHVVTSEQARSYKPDAVIFERALAKTGADPTRVAHVGDSLHSDILGASKLGITTIWINREDRIHDIGNTRPDHTIHSLAELPDLLERL